MNFKSTSQISDDVCLLPVLHLTCYWGFLTQHTSVWWHHPCWDLSGATCTLGKNAVSHTPVLFASVILSALPLPPWWQVCSLKSIWQPWPGKVHIWHWTCHSAFILPTPPSPRQGITLSLSRYWHSFFSHLNTNCFIAGIVGIVVTRWPVKPRRWYERYWCQLSAKESVSSDILSWMQIWDRWIDGQSEAQAGSL